MSTASTREHGTVESEIVTRTEDSDSSTVAQACPRSWTPAQKLRAALELAEFAERAMQQVLRRRHPDATEEEIAERLQQWRLEQDGHENETEFFRPRKALRTP